MTQVVSSLARFEVQHPRLFAEFERVATDKVESFGAKGHAGIVWAYAKVGAQAPGLFEAVAKVTTQQACEELGPKGLSNMVWAYATHGKVFYALVSLIGNHDVSPLWR